MGKILTKMERKGLLRSRACQVMSKNMEKGEWDVFGGYHR